MARFLKKILFSVVNFVEKLHEGVEDGIAILTADYKNGTDFEKFAKELGLDKELKKA